MKTIKKYNVFDKNKIDYIIELINDKVSYYKNIQSGIEWFFSSNEHYEVVSIKFNKNSSYEFKHDFNSGISDITIKNGNRIGTSKFYDQSYKSYPLDLETFCWNKRIEIPANI